MSENGEKTNAGAAAFWERGNEHLNKKEYGAAIEAYTKAIELQPDFAEAFYNRGNAYQQKGDYGKAIADYNEATRLKPKNAKAFNNRGVAYLAKKAYDKTIADFDAAIQLKPDYAVAFLGRGLAYRNKGDYGKAIADYNEATRLLPDFMKANNPQAPQFPVTEKQGFAGSTFVYNISGNSNSPVIMDSPYAQINITANEENAVLKYLNELADNNKNDMALQKILQKTQTAIKGKKHLQSFFAA